MASLVSKVSSAVVAYARRLTRRLLRARARGLQRGGGCLGRQLVLADGGGKDDDDAGAGDDRVEDGQGAGALWRRAILMGQRCEPLDFPGAIHYDSFGRRVQSPRCGSSSRKVAGALFCRSSDAFDDAAVTAARQHNTPNDQH